MALQVIFTGAMGHFSEGGSSSASGDWSASTSIYRNGQASFKSTGGLNQYYYKNAGGTNRVIWQSCIFYLKIVSLPSSQMNLILIPTLSGVSADLNSTGTFGCGGVTSTKSLTADSQWHKITVSSTGTTRRLYVDGELWCDGTGNSAAPQNSAYIGGGTQSGNGEWYMSDFRIYDGDVDDLTGGAYFVRVLLPTADPASLNSWTNGGGGTTSIFEGVNNIPPTGAAASTDGIKIKNAANGGNLDYVATMQTYAAAGIPVGSKINAVMAICNDGEEVGTNTKAGNLWISANPAQSAAPAGSTFDYGDDVGALGTFPTGWTTHVGVVTSDPSVTLSTAPTVTVRKTTSTTRVVDVDFLGLYVDYTLPVHLHAVSQPVAQNFHTIVPV